MISLEAAQRRILESVAPLRAEILPLLATLGSYAATPVISPIDLPVFDNSAMDGYAVLSEDLQNASAERPVALNQIGRIGAGEQFSGTVLPGTCVRLFTGSLLPRRANAVVMQEDVVAEGDAVRFIEPVKPFENIRLRGEDIRAGTELMRAGDRIGPTRAGLLAAIGLSELPVHRAPRVALLATGDELIEPGTPLSDGKIYESNRTLLASLLREIALVPTILPLVRDDLDATIAALQNAFSEHDVVLTTGGVSVGEFDFVKSAFEKIGGEIDHWKVAIRPGKPFVFGRFEEKHLFGLPGNPVSALVTFLVLVRPALLKMAGAQALALPVLPGELTGRVVNRGDRRHFMRARIEAGKIRIVGPQASHMLGSLGDANCLLDIPPETTLEAGSPVLAQLWMLPER